MIPHQLKANFFLSSLTYSLARYSSVNRPVKKYSKYRKYSPYLTFIETTLSSIITITLSRIPHSNQISNLRPSKVSAPKIISCHFALLVAYFFSFMEGNLDIVIVRNYALTYGCYQQTTQEASLPITYLIPIYTPNPVPLVLNFAPCFCGLDPAIYSISNSLSCKELDLAERLTST